MVDVLERPRGYNLGCILAEPIRVDRSFRHGEKFRWEEFELTVVHSPGHTEYQMALFTEIDGARVAFTGDAFFPAAAGAPYQLRHNLISRSQAAGPRAHHGRTSLHSGGLPFIRTKSSYTSCSRLLKAPTYSVR
jgi:hypothetical protein